MPDSHIAQLNIARPAFPLEDPRMADFVNNLERVNAAAERSPGFVWRLQDDSGNATGFVVGDDPSLIVNMSVWETVEDLERFVWQTVHHRFYRRRGEWFVPPDGPGLVMWRVAPGTVPSLEEAAGRLAHLAANGPSDYAFGWEHLPDLRAWREKRCA